MSDFVIHKGQRSAGSFARHYGSDAKHVIFEPGKTSMVTLNDGRSGQGSCLGCGEAPCMEKNPSELALPAALDDYPGDPSLDVCPTRAILWDQDGAVATITEDCIGCGLCVVRCPYGAIHLAQGSVAQVQTTDPDGLVMHSPAKGTHSNPMKAGLIALLDAPAAAELPTTVGRLESARAALLIRNLLHESGVNARVRRAGDMNMRIDAVGASRSTRPFVAEIELSKAVLDSPRALLEDVAVMHSRCGFAVADIDALSIALVLPNVRTDYYRVISDIDHVVGVRCRTITVGVLVALLWTNTRLDALDDDAFAVSEGRVDLEAGLGIPPSILREPYPGAFRPAK